MTYTDKNLSGLDAVIKDSRTYAGLVDSRTYANVKKTVRYYPLIGEYFALVEDDGGSVVSKTLAISEISAAINNNSYGDIAFWTNIQFGVKE